jgi:predicted aspartyl protease
MNVMRALNRTCSNITRLLLITALVFGGVSTSAATPDYAKMYAAHDFFALRHALASEPHTQSDQTQFYMAVVMTAFNRPTAADKIIDKLLHKPIDVDLRPKLLEMRLQNARRLSDYAGALKVAQTLIAIYEDQGGADKLMDLRNTVKLLGALSTVPQQMVVRHGASHITLMQDDKGGYCIPLVIGTESPCYILDTGANHSILIRSEAERLHLKVLSAGIALGTSTDAKLKADIAVAPLLKIENLEYRNVVFLVVPDAAFTMKDFQIRGILGYPIFSGMGAMTTFTGHIIDVPAIVPDSEVDDIAFDGNDILTKIKVNGHAVLCRIDTGADHTVFYKSYYERYKTEVEKAGTLHVTKIAGGGGIRTFKGYSLPHVDLELAGHTITLPRVTMFTGPVIPQDYLMCNLGLDAFKGFKSYTINLHSMALSMVDAH